MTARKRTSVEDALGIILEYLHKDTLLTTSEIASATNLSWNVVDRAVRLVMDIQGYFHANKIEVLGGRGRKIVLVELKIDLTRLPNSVREWFIEEKFFKGEEKKHYTTDEAREILGAHIEDRNRTRLEDAIRCILEALELEDELSVLELSKRTALNRRTIERVLDIFQRFQNYFATSYLEKIEGSLVHRNHPDIYGLDETRMMYMLKKLYLPHLRENLTKDKERALFQTA